MARINLFGGLAVLESYAYGLTAYSAQAGDFWGGVPNDARIAERRALMGHPVDPGRHWDRSLGLLAGLVAVRPRSPSLAHKLAAAGSLALCTQTAILDALVWPTYFPVQG